MANNFKNDPVIGDETITNNVQPVAEEPQIDFGKIPPVAGNPPTDTSQSLDSLETPDYGLNEQFVDTRMGTDDFLNIGREQDRLSVADKLSETGFATMTEDQRAKALELGLNGATSGTDVEDILAKEEGVGKAFLKGTAGFAAKVALNTVGGLGATAWGIGDMVLSTAETGQIQWSKFMNNAAFDIYDDANKIIEDNLGLKKSKEFQEAGFFEKMKNPMMFLDGIGDAVAFTVSALLTESLTGGMATGSVAARFSKIFRTLTLGKAKTLGSLGREAALAVEATSVAAKTQKLKNLATFARQTLITGSAFEAAIETRGMEKELRARLEAQGRDPKDIEETLSKARGITYIGNLVLVSSANSMMFSGMFKGPGSFIGSQARNQVGKSFLNRAGERITRGVTKEGVGAFIAEEGKTLATRNASKWARRGVGVIRALSKPATEGLEEASQSILKGTVADYYARDEKSGDLIGDGLTRAVSAGMKNFAHEFTSKEGWNEILTGAVVGGMGMVSRVSVDPTDKSKGKKWDYSGSIYHEYISAKSDMNTAENIVDTLNGKGDIYTHEKYIAAIRSSRAMEDYVKSAKGNKKETDFVFDNYVYEVSKPYVKHGYVDIFKAQLEAMKESDPEAYARSVIEPEHVDKFVEAHDDKSLKKWRDDQVDTLLEKVESLAQAYETMEVLGIQDEGLKDIMANLLYKVKSIPKSNQRLSEALRSRVDKAVRQNIKKGQENHPAIQTLIGLIDEMVSGSKYIVKDGKRVRRGPDEILEEFNQIAPDLLNINAINEQSIIDFDHYIRKDGGGISELTGMQGGAFALVAALDSPQKDAMHFEFAMMNSNAEIHNKYVDAYNFAVAHPLENAKVISDNIIETLEEDIDEVLIDMHKMSRDEFEAFKRDVKVDLDKVDAVKHKEAIERVNKKMADAENDFKVLEEEREAAAKEFEEVSKDVSESSEVVAEDSTIEEETNSDEFNANPYIDAKVPDASLGTTDKDGNDTPEFVAFLQGLREAGVTPTESNTSVKLSFFSGTFSDSANASNFDGKLEEYAAMSESAFVKMWWESTAKPEGLHIRADIEVKDKAGKLLGGKGKFSSYINSQQFNKEGKKNADVDEIIRMVKKLHQKIKSHVNLSKTTAKFKNISIPYKRATFSKGFFKRSYDSEGNRIIKDIPLSRAINTKEGLPSDHTNKILDHIVISNSLGRIVKYKGKVAIRKYANLTLDKNGKKIKGAFFIEGVDQLGNPTLFKVNSRRIGDDAGTNTAVARLVEAIMTMDLSPGNQESASAQAKLTEDILKNNMPDAPFSSANTVYKLLGRLVNFGEKTTGTANEFKVYPKSKAIKLRGVVYKYNEKLSKDAEFPIFDKIEGTGANAVSTVGLDSIITELGKLRQQVDISSLADEKGQDYRDYVVNNVLVTDIDLNLELKDDGKGKGGKVVDFTPVLERSKIYVSDDSAPVSGEIVGNVDLAANGFRDIFGKEAYESGTKIRDIVITDSPIGDLSFKQIFNWGTDTRFKVYTSNMGERRVKIKGVEIPDGVHVNIKGVNAGKGKLTIKFTTGTSDKAKLKEMNDVLATIPGFKGGVAEINISDIKNISSLSIEDTEATTDNFVRFQVSSLRKAANALTKLRTDRIAKEFFTRNKYSYVDSKTGKKVTNDSPLEILYKKVFFPSKDPKTVTNDMVSAALKEAGPDFQQTVSDIIYATTNSAYNKRTGEFYYGPVSAMFTLGKFTTEKPEMPSFKNKSFVEALKLVNKSAAKVTGSLKLTLNNEKFEAVLGKLIMPLILEVNKKLYANYEYNQSNKAVVTELTGNESSEKTKEDKPETKIKIDAAKNKLEDQVKESSNKDLENFDFIENLDIDDKTVEETEGTPLNGTLSKLRKGNTETEQSPFNETKPDLSSMTKDELYDYALKETESKFYDLDKEGNDDNTEAIKKIMSEALPEGLADLGIALRGNKRNNKVRVQIRANGKVTKTYHFKANLSELFPGNPSMEINRLTEENCRF